VRIYYDESPAGHGKTWRALEGISKSPCKTIFFTERKESFGELTEVIAEKAAEAGMRPVVRHIHGDMLFG